MCVQFRAIAVLVMVLALDQIGTVNLEVAWQRKIQHRPAHTVQCRLAHAKIFARMTHGGPLACPPVVSPGTGNYLQPPKVATTLSMPALQHGHCMVSSLATRAMNACADSAALGLGCGICNASLASLSLSVLHALASTP
jgi:hypothetical protein